MSCANCKSLGVKNSDNQVVDRFPQFIIMYRYGEQLITWLPGLYSHELTSKVSTQCYHAPYLHVQYSSRQYGTGAGAVLVRCGCGTGSVRVRYWFGAGAVLVRCGCGTGTVLY